MGFRKPLDYNSVQHQIHMAGVELRSHYNDGFNQWEIKKDLYKLKWLLDGILKESPEFADEAKYLEENEKKIIWKTLHQ